MLEPDAVEEIHHYCMAAFELMRGSRRMEVLRRPVAYVGGERLTHRQLATFCDTAAERNVDIVYLEFDDRISLGLRHALIVTPRDGSSLVHTDLAFWTSGRCDTMVLAPTTGQRNHFAWSPDGIEHRQGKVAPSLADGFRRAARLLDELVR